MAQKRILLIVSGGIAAYKACDLASRLVKEGASVTAILTRGARRFVTPFTFEALTGNPCLTRNFKRLVAGETAYPHIDPANAAGFRQYIALRSVVRHHISQSPGRKLRDEQKFDGLDALTRQIALDVENAKKWFIEHE